MFDEAIDEVLNYLEAQKERGVKYVQVSPETLKSLLAEPETERQRPGSARSSSRAMPRKSAESAPSFDVSSLSAAAPLPSGRIQKPENINPYSGMDIEIKLGAALTREEKLAKMAALREESLKCGKCTHLVSSRRNVVFGVGDVESPLLFIGEAPGADEDIEGEPFVGRAGQLLMKIIAAMGLSREKVFIANILKCRPDTPGQTSGNRPPTPQEMQTCYPWLVKQIEIIQPRVIVALGATAVNALLAQTVPISRIRGKFQPFHGMQVMPTFHPSYLLRYANATVKRQVWEDMLQVMEFLGMEISEKQRGYFL